MNNQYKSAIVHFGSGPGPFCPIRCKVRYKPNSDNPHKSGPIKSHWQVRLGGGWRNVWISNDRAYPFIKIKEEKCTVQFQGAEEA